MQRYYYTLLLLVLITGCRKSYECHCTTVTTNNSGPENDSTVAQNIYASPYYMTRRRAETWCDRNERNEEIGGGKHISSNCVLSGR